MHPFLRQGFYVCEVLECSGPYKAPGAYGHVTLGVLGRHRGQRARVQETGKEGEQHSWEHEKCAQLYEAS
jgi:hypothetical protein